MFDSIIYFTIVTIASIISQEHNFFLKMITIDSLFNAIHFFKIFINKNLTDSQIIRKTNTLYNGTLLDRYIYYLMIYSAYKCLCIFFWISNSFALYYLEILTIIPTVINIILKSKLFQIIREKKELFVKIIISKIFAIIIKFYSKLYLEKEIKIKYKEILQIFKDYKETINYFTDVSKNLLIIIILSYVKDYSTTLYYGVIKYVYNYKTGNLLASYDCESAKQYLIDIVDNRKWNELMKPNAYKAILHLYQINNEKSEILKKLITNYNFSIIKMVTIWTIASLCGNIYIIPIISMFMILYKKYIKKIKNNNIGEFLILLISIPIAYFYNNYILINVLTQFGSKLFFNKITFIMLETLYKSIKQKFYKIFLRNRDFAMSYLITILYAISLKIINVHENYLIIGLNLFTNILMSIEIKKQIIFGILLCSVQLSNFNIAHILFNSLILYLITGIIDITNLILIQDYLGFYINNLFLKIKKTMNIFTDYLLNIYLKYLIFRKLFADKFKSLIFSFKKNKKNNIEGINKNLIFELMDKEKFPSIYINSFQNNNILLKDSVSFDDEIFTQPEDIFINGISVDDNEINNNIYIVSRANKQCYSINYNFIE